MSVYDGVTDLVAFILDVNKPLRRNVSNGTTLFYPFRCNVTRYPLTVP